MNEGLLLGVTILVVIVFFVWYGISESKKKRKEQETRETERRERIEKRRLALIGKYGEEIGMKLFNQQFFIGMTKEQVQDSKGLPPDKKEREELKTKVKETWIYGNKSSGDVFIFENEILTKYKDR